jgi:hypothetical protein
MNSSEPEMTALPFSAAGSRQEAGRISAGAFPAVKSAEIMSPPLSPHTAYARPQRAAGAGIVSATDG